MNQDELKVMKAELVLLYPVQQVAKQEASVLTLQGGIATPADASLMMQLGAETVFVGSGIFMSDDPVPRGKAIVDAVTYYKDL